MPALSTRSTDSRISSPPSIFTAWAPDSFMIRMADFKASSELAWYEPKGISTTTNARLTAFTTPVAW